MNKPSLTACALLSATSFVQDPGFIQKLDPRKRLGLFVGKALGQRLSGPRLQKVFAFALLAVAAFILARTVV